MTDTNQFPYLYLTTLGWKSGKHHEIEIWFTAQGDRYYVISEKNEHSHWVQNLRHSQDVAFRIGEQYFKGRARIVETADDADLCRHISELSVAKYGWGDGLVVELTPSQGEVK